MSTEEFQQAKQDIAQGMAEEYAGAVGRLRLGRGMLKMTADLPPEGWPEPWGEYLKTLKEESSVLKMDFLEEYDATLTAIRDASSPADVFAALSRLSEVALRMGEGHETH